MTQSFAETAMRLSGKSDTEARSIGAVDSADDATENLFDKRKRTNMSPAFQSVWNKCFPTRTFTNYPCHSPNETVMKCMQVIRSRYKAETMYDDNGKLHPEFLKELQDAGYFGLLVEPDNIPFVQFADFLSRVAMYEPSLAGLGSVHGCIGSVDPVTHFGTPEQKEKWLPILAKQKLSAFALTEPGAGSDLTALKTKAVKSGDYYVLTGEKLFITNADYGNVVSVVCLIDDKPKVLLVELPDEDTEEFRLENYGIYALRRLYNRRIVFNKFYVPKENLLPDDGLTIAYHGLNKGRVALCANASGCMNMMLRSMIPWAKYRKTYGETIDTRELVRGRIGKLAAYIFTSQALMSWCGNLLDEGYRGELECIIAKVYGSERQKEAAIDLCMKTHGGRSFLEGHLIGDNIHEFLAPLIYEGEGDMLSMAFFKSLVKDHGKAYFEPIGKLLAKKGATKPTLGTVAVCKLRDSWLAGGVWRN